MAREEYAHIFRFCLALAGNPDEAQDLAQQAFTALAKHHARVQDWSKIRSWLFTTARRVFLKQEAKMARRREFPLDEAGENFFAEAAPDFGIQLDGQSAVAALQELETPMREVLALYYLEDFSYEEIAAQLEIPIGTVMSRLHRGKKQLAAILNHKDNHATPRADRNP